MASEEPLVSRSTKLTSPEETSPEDLQMEVDEVLNFISRVRKIPLLEWSLVPFFAFLGTLFLLSYLQVAASWTRYITLALFVFAVFQWKCHVIEPLAKIPIGMYSKAVNSVLHGEVGCKGKLIAKIFCSQTYSVSKLILFTSMTTLGEQATTAFSLPALLATGDASAYYLLMIVLWGMFVHIRLFQVSLQDARMYLKALPELQSRFDPLRDDGRTRSLTRRQAECFIRNLIWKQILDASFMGNLIVVADVSAQMLKHTSAEFPADFYLDEWTGVENVDILLGDSSNSLPMMYVSTGASSFRRIMFRLGVSTLPKVFLKLYTLGTSWGALGAAGRAAVVVSAGVSTLTAALAMPDAISQIAANTSKSADLQFVWSASFLSTFVFSASGLLILVLIIDNNFGEVLGLALIFGSVLGTGALAAGISFVGKRPLKEEEVRSIAWAPLLTMIATMIAYYKDNLLVAILALALCTLSATIIVMNHCYHQCSTP